MDPDEEYIDEESDFESSDIEEDKEINEKRKTLKLEMILITKN